MLPIDILRAAQAGRLMVLAGAGISKDPPSNLPDWRGFNRTILEEIVRLAREAAPQSGEALTELLNADIPVTAFSETVVSSFAGDSYFPVLRALESDAPNRNHDALGELARRHQLAAIFTTNFDTLIEQAFLAKGVELRLFVDRSDFTGINVAPPCALFKVHGSVKQTSTLIDTVSQKLRGLPLWVRHALAGLDPSYALLVIGFSGADLDFGTDYLPILGNRRFVTWVVNPDREPSPRVTAKVHEWGGAVVKATLEQVFADLGVELPPLPAGAPVAPEGVRELVAEWLQLPHIGAWTCAAFCAELLSDLGRNEAAQTIAGELAASLHERTEVPLTAAKVYRVLGHLAMQTHDFDAALGWYARELAHHEALQRLLASAGRAPSPEGRREHAANIASALINAAVARRVKGELTEAAELLRAAMPRAVEVASPYLLSRIEINLALLSRQQDEPPDVVIEHARNAALHSSTAGHAQALIEAHCNTAGPLLDQGEYGAAERELEAAEALIGLHPQIGYAIECARLRGGIAARRGDDGAAVASFEKALQLCGMDAARRWSVMVSAVDSLAHGETARPWLLALCDALEQECDDEDRKVVAQIRELLAAAPPEPLFFRVSEHAVRPDLRIVLMRSEHGKDATTAGHVLALLLREGDIYSRPLRMRDVALALLDTTRVTGDRNHESQAWCGLGIAADRLDDLDDAAASYRRALDLAPNALDAARTRLNLAMIVSRNGAAPEEVELLFEGAREELERSTPDDRTRLYLQWGRHRARHHLDGALELARKAREAANDVAHPGAAAQCDELIAELAPPEDALPRDASAPELANAGIRAMETGNLSGARELILRAKAIYETAGDHLGVSRCFNNLADLAHREGRNDDAIELATQAMAIRSRLGDTEGEALSRATIAGWSLPENPQQAFEHAERALLLLQGRPASRAKVLAGYALTISHTLLGRGLEARKAARETAQWIAASGDRSLQPILEILGPFLEEERPRRATATRGSAVSAIVDMLLEAQRLNRTRHFDEALALLAEAEARPDATDIERAMVAGDRANVLQSMDRNLEAAAEYEAAARRFRECGRVALAQQAVCQGAVSLRRAGELAKSETWLRALLAEPPDPAMLTQTRISLAKTITMPFTNGEPLDPADPRFAEAETLVRSALAEKLDDGDLAHTLFTNAQLYLLAGRNAEAESELEKARVAFLRVNSPYVQAVEAQLAALRET